MEKRIAIIGGGPCGLTCAITLALKGHQIDIYEKGEWPVFKVCGEGIMPSGFQVLKELDALKHLKKEKYKEFKGIQYHQDGNALIKGDFQGGKRGVAIARQDLSEALYLRSKEFNNITHHPHTLIKDLDSLSHHKIILCEGIRGKIKKDLGLSAPINHKRKRMGAHAYFNFGWKNDYIELHWGKYMEAYITPISRSRTQLTILWDDTKIKLRGHDFYFNTLRDYFPHLNQFTRENLLDQVRSYGPFDVRGTVIQKGRIILAGDDLYFLDGITGEGLSLAFKQAKLIANHLTNDGLSKKYFEELLDCLSTYEFLTRVSLIHSDYAFVRRFSLNLLQAFESLFPFLIRVNDDPKSLNRSQRYILKLLYRIFNKDFKGSIRKSLMKRIPLELSLKT